MKVICKKNTAKNLSLKEVTSVFSEQTQYPLEIDKEYMVMGIAIFKNKNYVYYLVDNGWRPNWMPYELFEITDKAQHWNWYVDVIPKNKYPNGDGFYFSGFFELCNDEDYHDLLMVEREPKALEVYWKRKHEFEEWYAEREEARKFYPEEAKKYYSIND